MAVQGFQKGGKFHKVEYRRKGKNYEMHLNFTPIFEEVQRVQGLLDKQVWQDVQKYMPVGETGQLKAQTAVLNAQAEGTGRVYYLPQALPYAHYQYEGIVYVDPVYGYACFPIYDENGVFLGLRSRLGVEKVPSNRYLRYTQPNAQRHWDEVAVKNHKKQWEQLVYEEFRLK